MGCQDISAVRLWIAKEDICTSLLAAGAQEIPILLCECPQSIGGHSSNCEVRALTSQDFGDWQESFLWFQQDQLGKLGLDMPKFDNDDLARLFEEVLQDGPALCAKEGDKMLGVAAAAARPDGSCYLSELWVIPAAQRRGVGQALLQAVVAAVEELGCSHMMLCCIASNLGALSF